MNPKFLLCLIPVIALTGCETLQTPQQRQQEAARKELAARHADEQSRRVKGKVESVEMETARLMQEMQQLRQDVRAYNNQISQLNRKMSSLESKQAREMNELIKRVEGLLKKSVGSRPSSSRRGAGREHVVVSGNTLSVIASAYKTSVKSIKKANNLKSDSIYVGQKLFIPE